jgi:hypothetical protein
MLEIIVRGTGELPKFVETDLPNSKTVVERLQQFEAALNGASTPDVFLEQIRANSFFGLYDEAPYQVIRLAAKGSSVRLQQQASPIHSAGILRVTTEKKVPGETAVDNYSLRDPYLLLTTFSTMVGESKAQDEHIGSLIRSLPTIPNRSTEDAKYLGTQIRSLISGTTSSGTNAKRMLREMVTKAKSQVLVDAIREIDPAIETRVIEAAGNH